MPFVLGMEVDLVSVSAIVGAILTAAGVGLRVLWNGGLQVAAWAKPRVEKSIEAHNEMVTGLAQSVPVVRETLTELKNTQARLCETQDKQCESLAALHQASERHERLHANTGEKLDQILTQLQPRE